MKRRKLQATGGSSITLTLPKSWVNRWGLGSKDEVLVSETSTGLYIRPAVRAKRDLTLRLSLDEQTDSWIAREMIGAYIAGVDRIELVGSPISPAQNQAIRQTIQLFFGFEIIKESSQEVVARTLLDTSMLSIPDSTIGVFQMSRSMFEDALKAAQNGDKELAADITQRDYEVNKFVYAIKRRFQEVLSGKIDGNAAEAGFYRSIAGQIERIGDHAVKIAELASSDRTDPVRLSQTFPTIQEGVRLLLEDTETMLRQSDKQQAHAILDRNQELEQLIFSSKRMKQSYEGAIIEDSIDRLRGYLMNIAERMIDYQVSRQITG